MSELVTEVERQRWHEARTRLGGILDGLAGRIRQCRFTTAPTARLERTWQLISDVRYRLTMHDHELTAAVLAIDWERFATSDHDFVSRPVDACAAIADCSLRRILNRGYR